jgi:dihydroorotate dehydrogenase (NAD+) catalytic subunit
MMIDLAPGHKTGLLVQNPVLLAGGSVGYGEALASGLAVKQLGAVVIGPLLRQSGSGVAPPRLAEVPGGFVLGAGLQNRGVNDVVKRFARQWARLGAPVIVQVAELRPTALSFVLERLAPVEAVAGLELLVGAGADGESVKRAISTTMQISDLPIWVKVPLAEAVTLAPVAVEAGAVGIVVGQPPLAAALRPNLTDREPALVQGMLYGPVLFHLMLAALLAVSKLALPAALIACGGIHTEQQARTVLQIAGVRAVQIDSALWIEPGLPGQLAAALDKPV